VGDVVAALIRLSDHPDTVGHVLNIGNDEEVTIRELAERVKAMTGSRSPGTRSAEDRAAHRLPTEPRPRQHPRPDHRARAIAMIGGRDTPPLQSEA
jgi:nucleoside-diphosphate-sugar epimerase